MDHIRRIEEEVMGALASRGLTRDLAPGESQFLYLGYNSVEIVVLDASRQDEVAGIVAAVQERLARENISFEFLVRAKWNLEAVREEEVLRTADGMLTAAVVVPVLLRAGSQTAEAKVIITWEARESLRFIMRSEVSVQAIAEAISRTKLRSRGAGSWNPLKQPTLQVNSADAPYLNRVLKNAA